MPVISQTRCPPAHPFLLSALLAALVLGCGSDVERARRDALAAHERAAARPSPENSRLKDTAITRYCRLVQARVDRTETWEDALHELRVACADPLRCDSIPMCAEVRAEQEEGGEDQHDDH